MGLTIATVIVKSIIFEITYQAFRWFWIYFFSSIFLSSNGKSSISVCVLVVALDRIWPAAGVAGPVERQCLNWFSPSMPLLTLSVSSNFRVINLCIGFQASKNSKIYQPLEWWVVTLEVVMIATPSDFRCKHQYFTPMVL